VLHVTHALTAAALCRPGDSILIGPGEHTVEGLSICHPLRLIGAPGSSLLCRRPAAEAALEVWSNVRVEGLCMVATRAFCIRHNDGELHLSRCKLICNAEHLSHLYSAVVAAARQRKGGSAADAGRPAGRLTVEETSITGSMRAVMCQGDGKLTDVRVLGTARGHCFWFQVRQDECRSQQSVAGHRRVDCGAQGAQDGSGRQGAEGPRGGSGTGGQGAEWRQGVAGSRQARPRSRKRARDEVQSVGGE
jgi:hypothetical protein